MQTDRQIALWGGWIAGPAFGVAMMAAPEYLHLQPVLAATCFWGGILVFAVTVFVVAALQSRERERQKPMWPVYVMAVGMIIVGIGAAGYFWPRQSDLRVAEIPPPSDHSPSAPGIMLDIASGTLPRVAPPDGIVLGFEIAEKQGAISANPITYQLNPNEVIDWKKIFPEWPIFGISRCEITSTTNESVFEAFIPINLSFREMIPDSPNLPPVEIGGMIQATTGGVQMRSGRVMTTQSSGIRVGRIYPQTPYVIYFLNRTKYLADIVIPSEGKVLDFSKAGDDFEKKLKIKFGRVTGMHLPTSIALIKSPPASSSQAPPPPSTPEKR
jgi:hypothetical protein